MFRFNLIIVVCVMLSAVVVSTSFAAGKDVMAAQNDTLECVSRMKIDTNWNICRKLIFRSCEKHVVGSESHLGCLTIERNQWKERIATTLVKLEDILAMAGREMLVASLGQWYGYVGRNCTEVAKQKSEISSEAAKLGCEISQFVGINADLTACLAGESGSPYCLIKGR